MGKFVIRFQKLTGCSVLNIPERIWKIFIRFIYVHLIFATLLLVFGTACFCIGVEYSRMYDEVNCSTGINIWIPFLNLVVSFTGLLMIRLPHMHWASFIHFFGLCFILIIMLIPLANNILISIRWLRKAEKAPDEWALNFFVIDLVLTSVVLTNGLFFVFLFLIKNSKKKI
ncbi:unnamed protein product [Dracunculus medinensis]|uniref:DUF805 domain-containing protein n=1 Tax=Dracunculus medinensis TaxID=318479 RepID=A0A0N4UKI9_DRAME|nr:unnamed protein product [Dracunculus medinensis]